jgi:diguanylate cyclase (GGDEF)-like protein
MAHAIDWGHIQPIISKGDDHYDSVTVGDEKYMTYYRPLMNAKNEHIATVQLCTSTSKMVSELRSFVWVSIIVAAIGIALSKGLMLLLFNSIARRLKRLAASAEKLANGDLGASFHSGGNDEIGALGQSLQRATDKIASLFGEIFHMISEHKKGNVSFRFIAEDFRGQYETLAENILDLTNLSIKDRLTGLPNRRTIFSRLMLVRDRAEKENTPLSILMVDIDKFKNYGLEQGDAVMKKVAQILSLSIMAEIDMAGRWAGDVFLILLPNTDKDGAMHVAERIRAKVANCVVEGIGFSTKVTVSLGVFSATPAAGDNPDSLILKANEALYSIKGTGGDKIGYLPDTQSPA